jgi:hypothetical protein
MQVMSISMNDNDISGIDGSFSNSLSKQNSMGDNKGNGNIIKI